MLESIRSRNIFMLECRVDLEKDWGLCSARSEGIALRSGSVRKLLQSSVESSREYLKARPRKLGVKENKCREAFKT